MQYNALNTGAVDSGASSIYFSIEEPIQKFNAAASTVHIGATTGKVQCSVSMGTLALPNLLYKFPCTGHAMPSFKHNFNGIGGIYDDDCKVVFTKPADVVYNPQQWPIITVWREPTGSNYGGFFYSCIQQKYL